MGFSLITLYPAWFLILCIITGFGYSGLLYYFRKPDDFKEPTRKILALLRGFSTALICFLLLSPLLKSTSRYSEKPIVIMAIDNSASIRLNKDSVLNTVTFLKEYKELAERLSKKFDVQAYSFGDQVTKGLLPSFDDKQTNFAQLFDEVNDRFSNRNLAALILASDGIYNQGTDPLYVSEHAPYSIYTVALGDTSQQKDLVLARINYNRIAFLGNDFPVEITVNAFKLAGSNVKLSVSNGDQQLYSENIAINTQRFGKTTSIKLSAVKPGIQRYKISVSAIDGEISKANNSQDIFVEVLDSRKNILLLQSSPHPDVAVIKQAIEKNQSYKVDNFMLSDFNGSLSSYSLVILHQIPSLNDIGFQITEQLKSSNIPVLYIIGVQSNLPAYNNLMTGLVIPQSVGSFTESTGLVNPDFSLFSLSPEMNQIVPEFPPLKVPYSQYKPVTASQVLLYQRIGNVNTKTPLILFNQGLDRKSATIAGEGIWRWRLANYAKYGNHQVFDELFSRIVQYLSVKEDKSQFRVVLKNSFIENEAVEIDAELYNDSYQLVNEPEVNIEITDKEKKNFPFTFSRTSKSYYLNAGSLPPGEYSYKASTSFSGKTFQKTGVFTVMNLNVENINTVANHSMLNLLASRHNGIMVYPSRLEEIEKSLNNRDDLKTIVYTQKRYTDLVSYIPFLLLLLLLLSVEWFIRKRSGSY